ncbi:MAG: OB-fold nucleic acid binding domain-containing protein [Candidatus Bathyarchaeota archaeon]|nr:OB-fold nucleic acid binding domain-containing protein [Candidatus Bathyarchaeota archaeon]
MATEKDATPETVIQEILEKKPELSKEQLLTRLSVARSMTGGLIADVALLKMIAAELGVEIANGDETFSHRLSLGHLVTGLRNATVTGRVIAVYPVRTFDGAKPGKFASVTIADNDGTVRVIMWNEKADVVESGELQVGQIVKFAHGYTKADRFGAAELHLGDRSQIELNPENVKPEDYPTIDRFTVKIQEIKLEQKNVTLEGTVKDVYASSTFTRSDQTAGKVLRAKVADQTGEVAVVFWNEKADEVEPKLGRGSQIQIVNARVKLSQNGEVELHVDLGAYVEVTEAPKNLVKIDSLNAEGFSDICVEGEVASLPVSKEVNTSKGETVPLTSFDLKDETGVVRVTAWREHSETASTLVMGEKIALDNVYAKMGYNGKIELATRSTTAINRI